MKKSNVTIGGEQKQVFATNPHYKLEFELSCKIVLQCYNSFFFMNIFTRLNLTKK